MPNKTHSTENMMAQRIATTKLVKKVNDILTREPSASAALFNLLLQPIMDPLLDMQIKGMIEHGQKISPTLLFFWDRKISHVVNQLFQKDGILSKSVTSMSLGAHSLEHVMGWFQAMETSELTMEDKFSQGLRTSGQLATKKIVKDAFIKKLVNQTMDYFGHFIANVSRVPVGKLPLWGTTPQSMFSGFVVKAIATEYIASRLSSYLKPFYDQHLHSKMLSFSSWWAMGCDDALDFTYFEPMQQASQNGAKLTNSNHALATIKAQPQQKIHMNSSPIDTTRNLPAPVTISSNNALLHYYPTYASLTQTQLYLPYLQPQVLVHLASTKLLAGFEAVIQNELRLRDLHITEHATYAPLPARPHPLGPTSISINNNSGRFEYKVTTANPYLIAAVLVYSGIQLVYRHTHPSLEKQFSDLNRQILRYSDYAQRNRSGIFTDQYHELQKTKVLAEKMLNTTLLSASESDPLKIVVRNILCACVLNPKSLVNPQQSLEEIQQQVLAGATQTFNAYAELAVNQASPGNHAAAQDTMKILRTYFPVYAAEIYQVQSMVDCKLADEKSALRSLSSAIECHRSNISNLKQQLLNFAKQYGVPEQILYEYGPVSFEHPFFKDFGKHYDQIQQAISSEEQIIWQLRADQSRINHSITAKATQNIFIQAHDLFNQKSYAQCLEQLSSLPEDHHALFLRGLAHLAIAYNDPDHSEAKHHFDRGKSACSKYMETNKAPTNTPEHLEKTAAIMLSLARGVTVHKDLQQALQDLNNYLHLKPNCQEGLLFAAMLSFDECSPKAALHYLERAKTEYPENKTIMLMHQNVQGFAQLKQQLCQTDLTYFAISSCLQLANYHQLLGQKGRVIGAAAAIVLPVASNFHIASLKSQCDILANRIRDTAPKPHAGYGPSSILTGYNFLLGFAHLAHATGYLDDALQKKLKPFETLGDLSTTGLYFSVYFTSEAKSLGTYLMTENGVFGLAGSTSAFARIINRHSYQTWREEGLPLIEHPFHYLTEDALSALSSIYFNLSLVAAQKCVEYNLLPLATSYLAEFASTLKLGGQACWNFSITGKVVMIVGGTALCLAAAYGLYRYIQYRDYQTIEYNALIAKKNGDFETSKAAYKRLYESHPCPEAKKKCEQVKIEEMAATLIKQQDWDKLEELAAYHLPKMDDLFLYGIIKSGIHVQMQQPLENDQTKQTLGRILAHLKNQQQNDVKNDSGICLMQGYLSLSQGEFNEALRHASAALGRANAASQNEAEQSVLQLETTIKESIQAFVNRFSESISTGYTHLIASIDKYDEQHDMDVHSIHQSCNQMESDFESYMNGQTPKLPKENLEQLLANYEKTKQETRTVIAEHITQKQEKIRAHALGTIVNASVNALIGGTVTTLFSCHRTQVQQRIGMMASELELLKKKSHFCLI